MHQRQSKGNDQQRKPPGNQFQLVVVDNRDLQRWIFAEALKQNLFVVRCEVNLQTAKALESPILPSTKTILPTAGIAGRTMGG